jgi:hypothetical protein
MGADCTSSAVSWPSVLGVCQAAFQELGVFPDCFHRSDYAGVGRLALQLFGP